jgi:ATP-binding cassette subfamily B protein
VGAAEANADADDTRTEGDAERDIQITEAVRQGLDDTHPDRDRDDRSNTGMEVNR